MNYNATSLFWCGSNGTSVILYKMSMTGTRRWLLLTVAIVERSVSAGRCKTQYVGLQQGPIRYRRFKAQYIPWVYNNQPLTSRGQFTHYNHILILSDAMNMTTTLWHWVIPWCHFSCTKPSWIWSVLSMWHLIGLLYI